MLGNQYDWKLVFLSVLRIVLPVSVVYKRLGILTAFDSVSTRKRVSRHLRYFWNFNCKFPGKSSKTNIRGVFFFFLEFYVSKIRCWRKISIIKIPSTLGHSSSINNNEINFTVEDRVDLLFDRVRKCFDLIHGMWIRYLSNLLSI